MKKEVKILKKTVTSGIEKRVVSGKARNCKIVDEKVREVYDSFDKRYLPLNEFLKLYNEKGERLGVVKESDEDVKKDIGIEEDIGTEEDIKEDIDPFDWYLNKIYRK